MKDKCFACNGTGKFTKRQSPREYLLAYWRYVKHAEYIPEGAKTLALHLIKMANNTTAEIAGNMELSYRRGIQEGIEGGGNMRDKIGECLGIVYDTLKNKDGGSGLIAKVDKAIDDNELKKGFKEIIEYMEKNGMQNVACQLKDNLKGWI